MSRAQSPPKIPLKEEKEEEKKEKIKFPQADKFSEELQDKIRQLKIAPNSMVYLTVVGDEMSLAKIDGSGATHKAARSKTGELSVMKALR
jgi:hypothetical protein